MASVTDTTSTVCPPQSSDDGLPGAVSMQTFSHNPVVAVRASPVLCGSKLLAVAQTGNRGMAPFSKAPSSEAHSGLPQRKVSVPMVLSSALR